MTDRQNLSDLNLSETQCHYSDFSKAETGATDGLIK